MRSRPSRQQHMAWTLAVNYVNYCSIAATVSIGAARSRLLDRRRGISLAQQQQLPSSPPNDKQPLTKVFDSTLTTQKSSK
eukprot:5471734-Pleurochrysis_carterae.AAC.1